MDLFNVIKHWSNLEWIWGEQFCLRTQKRIKDLLNVGCFIKSVLFLFFKGVCNTVSMKKSKRGFVHLKTSSLLGDIKPSTTSWYSGLSCRSLFKDIR